MMTLKTAVSVDADNVAEWSKAPALGAGLARGVGSNPTVVTSFAADALYSRGTIGELGGEPWAPSAEREAETRLADGAGAAQR